MWRTIDRGAPCYHFACGLCRRIKVLFGHVETVQGGAEQAEVARRNHLLEQSKATFFYWEGRVGG